MATLIVFLPAPASFFSKRISNHKRMKGLSIYCLCFGKVKLMMKKDRKLGMAGRTTQATVCNALFSNSCRSTTLSLFPITHFAATLWSNTLVFGLQTSTTKLFFCFNSLSKYSASLSQGKFTHRQQTCHWSASLFWLHALGALGERHTEGSKT